MKSLASISLDLDNQWSYMKTHGDSGWESFPSYLDLVVPRVLRLFEARGEKLTFFIVGQDAALDKNHDALAQIAAAGHEIGNHSFHHEPWLDQRSQQEVSDELVQAEEAIERATGVRPDAFRGPGYALSRGILEVLTERGYRYDASTFPTYLGPLARAFYFFTARLNDEQKEDRKRLFGSMTDGLRPLKPYYWDLGARRILEIPVTTMPAIKTPFHVSYLLYLSTFSAPAARSYFRSALYACKRAGVQPSLLLHPLDFLGGDDVRELRFFPAMGMSHMLKLERLSQYLDDYYEAFDVVPMGQHAARLQAGPPLPQRPPQFSA